VLRYFTGDQPALQRSAEFYQRPLDPAQLPLDEFRPDVLLVENTPAFQPFTSRLPPDLVLARTGNYYEIRAQSP
jgi:hypothetical protein